KHEVVDVRIVGSLHFTTDEIRRRIKSRRSELFGHVGFSSDQLEEDRRTVEAMYRSAGFEDAVVRAGAEDKDHAITVTFQVEEGKQLPISAVEFTGNTHIPSLELLGALPIKPGDPYAPTAIDQSRAALTRLYYSRGYADARVERHVERAGSDGGVRVTFQVMEGESYILGAVLVAGN